ncbi:MAG: hypothetical protein PQJ59_07180 [Spirochaetales bacterium]|nr:hypothetical protein [Spirochaetales bacterium]
MKRRFPFLLIFIITLPLIAQEGVKLEWEGRDNYTYQIELKKYDTSLFIKRVEDPFINLDLAPGDYSYQITFFNKFDKADAQSNWETLKVIKDLSPHIVAIPEHHIFSGDRDQELEIFVAEVMDKARIILEKKGEIHELSYSFTGENNLELILETNELSPGFYDLRIINPSGSQTVEYGAIELKEKVNPLVKDLSLTKAFINDLYPKVILTGANLDEKMVAFLVRDDKRHRLPLSEYTDETEVALWFDLKGLKPGIYDLLLINPPQEELLVHDAFEIINPAKVHDEAFYDKIRWGTDLLISFPLLDIITESPVTALTYVENDGLYGYLPETEFILRMDMMRDHPLWQYLGGTVRFAFLAPFNSDDQFQTINLGLYGRTRFTHPLNLFMEGLLGYRWMDISDNSYDYSDVEEEGSLLTWGGGLVFNYNRLLLEGSVRRDYWLLKGEDEVSLTQFSLRMGYRF